MAAAARTQVKISRLVYKTMNLFRCRAHQVVLLSARIMAMSARQDNNPKTTKPNSGKIIMIGGIGTALAIINIATRGAEAQPQAVSILEYLCLALGLFALVGGIIMKMNEK